MSSCVSCSSLSDAGLLRMQQLFDALAEVGYIVELDMKQVTDADDAMNALDMFERLSQGHKSVVLDLPTLVCNELLRLLVTLLICFHISIITVQCNRHVVSRNERFLLLLGLFSSSGVAGVVLNIISPLCPDQ